VTITKTGTNASPHIKLTESGDTREFNIFNDGSGNGHLVLADTDDTPDTEIILKDNGVITMLTANIERLNIGSTGKITTRGTTAAGYGVLEFGTININTNLSDGTVDFAQGLAFTNNVTNEGAWTQAGICATGSSGYNGNLVFGTDGNSSRTNNAITEHMRITHDGKIGIGNNNPSGMSSNANKLVVGTGSGNQGMSVFAGTAVGRYAFARAVGNNTDAYDGGMAYDGSRNLTFHTNANAERMRITGTGNVGIGETAPANLLHVKASDTGIAPHSSAQIVLEREGTNYLQFLTAEAGTSGILFGDGSDVDVSAIKVDHNTTKMTFTNEAFDTMTLNGAKVGIGTANPTNKIGINRTSINNNERMINLYTGTTTANKYVSIGAQFAETNALSNSEIRFGNEVLNNAPSFLAFATGNNSTPSERVRITSAGLVGIGTNAPAQSLDTTGKIRIRDGGNTTTPSIQMGASGTSGLSLSGTNIVSFISNSLETFRIDAGQTFNFNHNDNGSRYFVVNQKAGADGGFILRVGNANKWQNAFDSAGSLKWYSYTANATVLKLLGSGVIQSPPTYAQTTSNAANMVVRSSGDFERSTSSKRYKNSITDVTKGLAELKTLRPVNYKGNNDGETVFYGLIAEEVHDAGLTEFVEYNDENQPDGLRYPHMVSLCIKAIQEQQTLIESLTARIEELEG